MTRPLKLRLYFPSVIASLEREAQGKKIMQRLLGRSISLKITSLLKHYFITDILPHLASLSQHTSFACQLDHQAPLGLSLSIGTNRGIFVKPVKPIQSLNCFSKGNSFAACAHAKANLWAVQWLLKRKGT